MFDAALTTCLRRLGPVCCLRIFGKAKTESQWRLIDIVATSRRSRSSGWPLLHGTCTTFTSSVIAVGWDFARAFFAEQGVHPASCEKPVEVIGGRLRDRDRRVRALGAAWPSFSEVMAHECGHTAQALRLGAAYLPLVGAVTLAREGNHWWNYWENNASAQGQMGGIAQVVIPIEQWPLAPKSN